MRRRVCPSLLSTLSGNPVQHVRLPHIPVVRTIAKCFCLCSCLWVFFLADDNVRSKNLDFVLKEEGESRC